MGHNGVDLLPGLTDLNGADDLFLFDHGTGRRALASCALAGPAVTGNGPISSPFSFYPSLSADGRVALFASDASDLTPGDHNVAADAFAYFQDLDYFTLTPCRLFDSRRPQDGLALASSVIVTLHPAGLCDIPLTARALALNLTVTGATGGGHLLLFPVRAG
jgi:hypothetical protein